MFFFAEISNQGLARDFIKSLSPFSLVWHQGNWYQYMDQCGWRCFSTNKMETVLSRFLIEKLGKMTGPNGKPLPGSSFTIPRVRDVSACLKALLEVPPQDAQTLDPAVFLKERDEKITIVPAEGWAATLTHHLHIPSVALALYRGEQIPTFVTREADSRLFTPGIIPCVFDPEAPCPRWSQFVDEVCPNDAKTLQMMAGMSLTYNRRYNVFFVIHGKAGTGKSTALNILAKLNTGCTCSVSLGAFGERFQEYPLTENRLNLVHDMDSIFEGGHSVSKREAVLKSCTCGEKITVERKYMDSEQRALLALPVFGCNSLPRFADRSQAISDRMRIISFPNVFRGTPQHDTSLPLQLESELPGIFIWALRGYGELLASGSPVFPESESAVELKTESIKASRPEELFCDECLQRSSDPTDYISSSLVYDAYREFCDSNGYRAIGKSFVMPEICRYMNVTKERQSTPDGRKMCFIGICLQQWIIDRHYV